jgi:lipopolysaccharide transport system ATP-binding protein
MEYDVLSSDHIFLPHFGLNNIDNNCAFISVDLDPQWRQKPRPCGRYISRATIPGNLLNEGLFFINSFMLTLNPDRLQFAERNAVTFNVIDNISRDTARGDYAKSMAGVLRPMLSWHTEYSTITQ